MAQQGTLNAALAGTIEIGGDFTVNRFGYGAMRITGEGIWGEPDDPEEAKRVLRRAIELGINFIDTADSYGPEVSERLIAEALYPYPDSLVIATKAGLVRPGPGQWVPNGRPEYLKKQVEGSLRRLRVDELDILQLHRPDPKVPLDESIGALVELKEQGKIRHIGICNVSVEQLTQAEKLTPIVSVQNRYNLSDRESEPVLEQCTLEGLAFLPWRPVGGGELEEERGGVLRALAEKYDATPLQIGLAWLLEHSPNMLPIPGTSKVRHLEENLGAVGLDIAPSDFADLDKIGEEA